MHEMIPNLVSTIIPVFNRSAWLCEAVDSVLKQTYRPIDVIIVNDGSTDDVGEVADSLAKQHPDLIRVVHRENSGAGPSREAGRQLAQGEFIQYLDSDDRLWPRKFERQVAALRANPECGAAYGWIRLCPENELPRETPHKWSGKPLDTLFPGLLVDRWWNTDCPLFRRSVCDAVGPWSNLRYSQDWEYDARVGALGTRLVYCPEFVCDQRHHSGVRQTGSGKWLVPADQLRFFTTLYNCAREAGVDAETPEMKHFARWVFSAARSAGRGGDADSARGLLALAKNASAGAALQMTIYGLFCTIFGWRLVERVAEGLRRGLNRTAGADTRKQSWME